SEDIFKRYCYTAKKNAKQQKEYFDNYDSQIFDLIRQDSKDTYWKLKEVVVGYSVMLGHLIEAIDFYTESNSDNILKSKKGKEPIEADQTASLHAVEDELLSFRIIEKLNRYNNELEAPI